MNEWMILNVWMILNAWMNVWMNEWTRAMIIYPNIHKRLCIYLDNKNVIKIGGQKTCH